jgi:hypothetical protein
MLNEIPTTVKIKTKVLIINGVARAGKDTFIDALQDTHQFYLGRYSIIDPIKVLAEIAGWEGDQTGKTEAGRRLLSDLKVATDNYNDFAFNAVLDWAEGELSVYSLIEKEANPDTPLPPPLLCIISREPKDIPRFKEAFKRAGISCRSVVIRNEEAEKNCPDNIADLSVLDCDYDLHYMNQGTKEEFVSSVQALMSDQPYTDNREVFLPDSTPTLIPLNELEPMILDWAQTRGIFDSGTLISQCEKLQEEVNELDEAIYNYLCRIEFADVGDNEVAEREFLPHVLMELGDVHVVATNIAKLANSSLTECGNMAYNKISKRKGSMQNGKYVKETQS